MSEIERLIWPDGGNQVKLSIEEIQKIDTQLDNAAKTTLQEIEDYIGETSTDGKESDQQSTGKKGTGGAGAGNAGNQQEEQVTPPAAPS